MKKGKNNPKTKKYSQGIKSWPEEERPRERLIKYGEESLSDAQLLAIILSTGSHNKNKEGLSALDLARKILQKFGNFRNLNSASITELRQISGIGTAKATQIKSALEIGKRLFAQKSGVKKKIICCEDVVEYFLPYLRDVRKEVLKALLLDGKNKIIKEITISEGSLTCSIVHPREVFKEAIKESAASIILVHNHPSGDTTPSKDDLEITNRLVETGELVDIKVLDHVIIGDDKYISFLEKGLIKN